MKKISKSLISKICVFAGVFLLVFGVSVVVFRQWSIHTSMEQSEAYVNSLRHLIPAPQGAAPEARRENAMARLSVDGTDFVGIIELPRYGSALPVCADWESIWRYPCRFGGSVYDGTVKIGASSQKGQYDFYREISVGDTVLFTDVEGNRYTYTVTDLRYEKHADQAALTRKEADLTLFIKNVYDFEYFVVFCQALT